MARRTKRKKKQTKPGTLQEFMVVLVGGLLVVSAISVSYGLFARHVRAKDEARELRIEVLNGTGHAGLAQKVALALMARGVDVFKVENADHFGYEESILIARRQGSEVAALGRTIGCNNVIEQHREDTFVDATLVVGADFAMLDLGLERESRLNE